MSAIGAVTAGMNAKYLPWELFALVVLVLAISLIYFVIVSKNMTPKIRIALFCLSIMAIFIGMEQLAIHTGFLHEYLSIIIITYSLFLIIGLILILF